MSTFQTINGTLEALTPISFTSGVAVEISGIRRDEDMNVMVYASGAGNFVLNSGSYLNASGNYTVAMSAAGYYAITGIDGSKFDASGYIKCTPTTSGFMFAYSR